MLLTNDTTTTTTTSTTATTNNNNHNNHHHNRETNNINITGNTNTKNTSLPCPQSAPLALTTRCVRRPSAQLWRAPTANISDQRTQRKHVFVNFELGGTQVSSPNPKPELS